METKEHRVQRKTSKIHRQSTIQTHNTKANKGQSDLAKAAPNDPAHTARAAELHA